MATKCLICDGDIQTNGINVPRGGVPTKKFHPDVESPKIPVLGDRSKFALTHVQYTVLQRVLTLPEEACKNELMFGPYCRECFTNINNVCHCMTALENLQQSVMEFRKDFGTKIQKSCDDTGPGIPAKGSKKRKSNPTDNNSNSQPVFSARSTILNYLNKGVFTGGVPNIKQNVKMNSNKHIHDTISNMDPNTQSPDTHVEADLVVRTTNGNMPAKKHKASQKKCNLPPKSKKQVKPPKPPKPLITATKQLKPVVTPIVNASVTPTEPIVKEENQGYKCWCCSRVFPTDAALDKHEEVSHRHKCTVAGCTRIFHTPKSLKSHMINTHKITLTKALNVRKMKKCDECSRYFPNFKALNKHQAVKHPKKPASTNSNNSSTTSSRPGRCKICSKIVMDIQAHMKMQHPEAVNENQQKSKTTITAAEETATNRDSPQQKVKTKVNNGIETRPMKSTRSNPDLFKQVDPKVTETEQSLFILKSEETNKTENNDEKLNSPPLPSPPLRSAVPFNFSVPSNIAKLPTPPQAQAGAGSSKYQFKNLLKIGDKI